MEKTMTHVRKGRTAKLNRRQVALDNLKTGVQKWKDATDSDQIFAMLSQKNQRVVKHSRHDRDELLSEIRKRKIALCDEQIELLETAVSYR